MNVSLQGSYSAETIEYGRSIPRYRLMYCPGVK
jgi:hypothetical protein